MSDNTVSPEEEAVVAAESAAADEAPGDVVAPVADAMVGEEEAEGGVADATVAPASSSAANAAAAVAAVAEDFGEEDPDGDLRPLIEALSMESRLRRQEAARRLSLFAEHRKDDLKAHVAELVDAMDRPEEQTRWQILDTLMVVGADDPELVAGAFEAAENALFEEGARAAFSRLAAFRYFVMLGKSSPERSDEVWPLLDEAAQVYHGLPEYREMLVALADFAGGSISDASRRAVADRVRFDAQGKTGGFLKSYSQRVLAVAEGDA